MEGRPCLRRVSSPPRRWRRRCARARRRRSSASAGSDRWGRSQTSSPRSTSGERARRDPLTGVLNHRAFHAAVAAEAARARRYRGRLALVLLDLDRFKERNDREGHAEGDRILRAFAAALAETVRENDEVGRLGGDEFGVLLLQAEPWAVDAFLERLRARAPGGIAASAGAAFLAEVGGASSEELFTLADRLLYANKTGRVA